MKPLRIRLQEERERVGLPWEVLERDYLISWVLAGISSVPSLRETLVFKGGTALRKCYFDDYRFSEDLDFTAVGAVPTGDAAEGAIREACSQAVRLLDAFGPVEIVCRRHVERNPHPGGQEAFDLQARLPWHRGLQTRIMVEITLDEKVLMPIPERSVHHGYGEPLQARLRVYSLEEIVAEKLRAILEHVEALEKRGWARSRARDYYDLWRILGSTEGRMDTPDFPGLLRQKCGIRGVTFQGVESFFPDALLQHVRKTWESGLGPLVGKLPPCETVISELRPLVSALLTSSRTI